MFRSTRVTGTRAAALASSLAAALTVACSRDDAELPSLPYDTEYPGIDYAATRPQGSLGRFASAVAADAVRLARDPDRGYLDAVLDALAIDPSSQVLVYSRTSLQTRFIGPSSPRAIYFNDESYVAWTPDAPTLEVSGFDPELGPIFYTLLQDDDPVAVPERRFGVCLRCHDTYGLSGGGVPRFLLGSGYTDTAGELVSHEAWILTSQATPLRSRWGGWYVTGQHGAQVHLGNIVIRDPQDLQDLEALRVGNIGDVNALFDASRYPRSTSDIVALMVLEHQVDVQNLLSRLRYESMTDKPLGTHVDALVDAMLMRDSAALAEPVTGDPVYQAYFESLGPFDPAGRTLRRLDLETRLFEFPLSYLIYSEAFQALPEGAKQAVYRRMRELLQTGAVPNSDAIIDILQATLPEALAD